MAITVRQLTQQGELGLVLVAGSAGADRAISWAHAIELHNPAPWLAGGELVMTTGLNIGTSVEEQFGYVEALVRAGSVALAIDTGMKFSRVPEGIRSAGDAFGLPVLEVRASTPFIAITRAVIDDLTADQVRDFQQVVHQQEELARAILRGGVPALVHALARALSATVVVIDTEYRILAEYGGQSTRTLELALLALKGGDSRQRHRRQSSRVIGDDDNGYCMIQRVGAAAQDLFGHLVVGLEKALSPSQRLLTAHAVSLLSIELGKPARLVEAEQRLRSVVAQSLIDLGSLLDHSLLRYFGLDPTSTMSAIAFTAMGALLPAERQVNQAMGSKAEPYLMCAVDTELIVIAQTDAVEGISRALHDQLNTQLHGRLATGVGTPALISDIAVSVRRATIAAHAARTQSVRFIKFDEMGAFTTLLLTQNPSDLAVLSDSVLGALDDYDRTQGGHLVTSLTAFLTHNGQTEMAATTLNVHRHTLRNRLQKIVELLDRDLESAYVRADLWSALQARQLLTVSGAGFHTRGNPLPRSGLE